METKQEFRICNQCGKTVKTDGTPPYGEGLSVAKTWGYFSGKDGERHHFFLCEDCYDKLVKGFSVPVDIEEETELL
ncbi:hypothetical protein LQE92_14005 [Lacrimispora sp. NSJ-141]|uniref:Uncharacterized protein n=1 Tax=Lientehia hominis TaxID=2897778 RepID=A0AAP2WAR5_9FIRM|nr:hypothetical protein [Lientehia hominis]MCD2493719.1 hypothetical protein [Lientehia hominis]